MDSKAIAARAYADPVFFCKFFLPHLFSRDIPWVHRGILAILTRQYRFLEYYGELDKIRKNFVYVRDGETHSIFNEDMSLNLGRYTLIMLPRGFSKTTIAGIAVPLREILMQDIKLSVYVSNAAPHAKMQLTNVKRELTDNDRIRAVFGDLRPSLSDDEKWAEDMFETTTGCAMIARGRGGQIRGLNHRGQRPQKIICDDLEDMESVATDLQREKTRNWAYGDLMPALPELDPSATIVALGTLLHADALLNTWKSDLEWTVVQFGALDVDGNPLWAENLDEKKLEAKKISFTNAGQLHVFYMEYFNKTTSPETQKFKPEYFIHEPHPDVSSLRCATYCDPAISQKLTADQTVIVTAGMNDKGTIWLIEVWARRGIPEREKIDEFFRQVKAYGSTRTGIESNAYQAALIHLMREEMFRKRQYFEITPVTHATKKEERIAGILQPRYANGYIKHSKRFPLLESQLLDFPGGAHDDCADAVAGAVALLDPFAAAAADGKDLGEDEYEPLEDWRWA